MNSFKFDFKTIVIIALLLLIIAGVILWPKKPDSAVIIQARDSIQRIQEANQVLLMQGKTLEVQLTEVKVKSSSDSMAFRMRISKLEGSLAKKRVKIDTLILENPDLADFVATADTVIFTMRQRIDSLEHEKQFQQSLYSEMIYIQNKRLQNLEIVASQKDVIIESQRKTIRKTKRGNRLLKAGAIALPVAAFIFGTQL